MPRERVDVTWQVASDEGMRHVVAHGKAVATPDLAHSVHVEVAGLQPARWYWYRFTAGAHESPVGRTRTAPDPRRANDRLAFAFVSCQHYETGYYTAYKHIAEEDLDLVVHLGDYIYEGSPVKDRPRSHNGPEPKTLGAYRDRYALYRLDPDLQRAHAPVSVDCHLGRSRGGQQLRQRCRRGQRAASGISGAARGRLPGLLRAHAAAARFDAQGVEPAAVPACGLRYAGGILGAGYAAVSLRPALRGRRQGGLCRRGVAFADDDGPGAGALVSGRAGEVAGALEYRGEPGDDGAIGSSRGAGDRALDG